MHLKIHEKMKFFEKLETIEDTANAIYEKVKTR